MTSHRAPSRPWIAWLLAVLVPPLYSWYWYWHLTRDVRQVPANGEDDRIGQRPLVAVSLLILGQLLLVPALVTLVKTGRTIARQQQQLGLTRRCRAGVAPLLFVLGMVVAIVPAWLDGWFAVATFVIGIGIHHLPVVYLQSHANDVVSPREMTRAVRARQLGYAVVAAPWTIVVLPLAVLVHAGMLDAYIMPSSSMEPTIHCGDRFAVESLTRRSARPERGDIVAFHPPAAADDPGIIVEGSVHRRDTQPADTVFVKRVIGLPGEKVEIRGFRAIVDADELDEPYTQFDPVPEGLIVGLQENFGPVRVPDDSYLLLGDHRDNSADSRVFGAVPRSYLIGRVVWRYFPFDRFGPIDGEPVAVSRQTPQCGDLPPEPR